MIHTHVDIHCDWNQEICFVIDWYIRSRHPDGAQTLAACLLASELQWVLITLCRFTLFDTQKRSLKLLKQIDTLFLLYFELLKQNTFFKINLEINQWWLGRICGRLSLNTIIVCVFPLILILRETQIYHYNVKFSTSGFSHWWSIKLNCANNFDQENDMINSP